MTPVIHATAPELVGTARQFGVGAAMIFATVAVHGAALFGLGRALRIERQLDTRFHLRLHSLRGLAFTQLLVLSIFLLHGLEILSYALLYLLLGAADRFEPALYLSTVSYATIGASDPVVAHGWRLLAAIEGINGWILLGWSTAFIVTVIQRVSRDGG